MQFLNFNFHKFFSIEIVKKEFDKISWEGNILQNSYWKILVQTKYKNNPYSRPGWFVNAADSKAVKVNYIEISDALLEIAINLDEFPLPKNEVNSLFKKRQKLQSVISSSMWDSTLQWIDSVSFKILLLKFQRFMCSLFYWLTILILYLINLKCIKYTHEH